MTDWHKDAPCKGLGDIFYPEGKSQEERAGRTLKKQYEQAKEMCQTCPYIRPCRALGKLEEFGVWGGTSPIDRGFTKSKERLEMAVE